MRILLITWACDRDDVSEPQITYRWVREISKRHEVTVFSISRPERFGCVKEQFPDLKVHEWKDIRVPAIFERVRAVAKPGFFLKYKKMRRFIKTLIDEQQFDIIHHLSPFAWRYASTAYGLGVPLVRGPVAGGLPTPKSFRSQLNEGFHPFKLFRKTDILRKRFDRRLIESYRSSDCIIAAAPYVKDLIYPMTMQRCEVEVEHGLEELNELPGERVKTIGREKKIRLLFVGRVIRTKGVRDAIRAISDMKTKNRVEFQVVGDGDDLSSCKKEVNNLHLRDIVSFRGWCTHEQVEKAYHEADIFLFPSFREPTGGVILEAMTHGIPIVACDYGGPAYLLDSKCGVKIAPTSPKNFVKELARELDRLVEDDSLRIKMGKQAMRYAYENFNWDCKMSRLDALYESLVK